MAASAAAATRRTGRFVVAGACWLAAWGVTALLGVPRAVEVALALDGFVFHVLFGKGYALIPSYFDRTLAVPRAPAVHLPLSVLGTGLLAAAPLVDAPLRAAGATLWFGGAAVFVGALAWTVRDNPTGAETGTGDHKAHLRDLDRLANAVVPVALAYLVGGASARAALAAGDLPTPVASGPAATHLLAAGTAALFVFAVGFRLLPRFFVADPPRRLARVVLPAGAVAPGLLAASFGGGAVFRVGAVLEALAVAGFAVAVAVLFRRSERRRVGLYGVLLAAAAGVAAVALGLWFAFVGRLAGGGLAHARLNLVGFLGLTVVGVTYQFYPPTVGSFPGAGDRAALASLACLAGGLAIGTVGLLANASTLAPIGTGIAAVGAAVYAYLVVGLVVERG